MEAFISKHRSEVRRYCGFNWTYTFLQIKDNENNFLQDSNFVLMRLNNCRW